MFELPFLEYLIKFTRADPHNGGNKVGRISCNFLDYVKLSLTFLLREYFLNLRRKKDGNNLEYEALLGQYSLSIPLQKL